MATHNDNDDEAAFIAAAMEEGGAELSQLGKEAAERGEDLIIDVGTTLDTLAATAESSISSSNQFKQSTLTSFKQKQPEDYLPGLNKAQLEAVTADLTSLQILAGPGSGKTKVLTTRVAYLLQHYRIPPRNLIIVTFTNKAANEMRNRLGLLVGTGVVNELVMGTFHSVCVRYLRRYGTRVHISNDFTIADRDDCLAIVRRAIKAARINEELRGELNPQYILDVVSKAKSKGLSPQAFRHSRESLEYFDPKHDAVASIYEEYQYELARDNALDFDDLLVKGLELVKAYPMVVSNVESVLIDEFQDTNSIQYDLVKLMARKCQSLTIVGDPDQSIYGWRSAEVENLHRMVKDFEPVNQVFLEENYRSTAAILGAALAIVRQDTKRIQKGLKATHGAGSSVVLHCAPTGSEEANYIAAQIKHLIAHTGKLVDYGDIAILLRYGALSRNIEGSLQRAGIPFRMVGGHKFFERAEVKDILSYLQLIDNPAYTSAFTRVVNVPLRGIGDKTVRDIVAAARSEKVSPFEMSRRLVHGSGKVSLNQKQKSGLKEFVNSVLESKKRADQGSTVPELIDYLTERIKYQAYLERSQGPDAKDRWENVIELKAFAAIIQEDSQGVSQVGSVQPEDEEFEEVAIPAGERSSSAEIIIVEEQSDPAASTSATTTIAPSPPSVTTTTDTPLRNFLATSMLATDSETNQVKDDAKQRKVTISTCHAAKGLEWPIVFVPACEGGTYPFYRCVEPKEIDEERRLLYVAITRAQGFCTLSYCEKRMFGADSREKVVSPFVSNVSSMYPTLFVPKLQKITEETRIAMAKVFRRTAPDEKETIRLIEEHTKTLPIENPDEIRSRSDSNYGGRGGYASQMNQYSGSKTGPASIPPGANAGFNTALSNFQSGGNGLNQGVNRIGGITKSHSLSGSTLASGSGMSSSMTKVSKPLPETTIIRTTSLPNSGSSGGTAAKSTAFKPPRPLSSVTISSSDDNKYNNDNNDSSSKPILNVPAYPAASAPASLPSGSGGGGGGVKALLRANGPLEPPETRASLISNAVLVGNDAEWKTKSVPANLADRFEKGELKRLNDLKELGLGPIELIGSEVEVEGPSSPPPAKKKKTSTTTTTKSSRKKATPKTTPVTKTATKKKTTTKSTTPSPTTTRKTRNSLKNLDEITMEGAEDGGS